MDGFLNVLKPPGMTSSDVVVHLRRRLKINKIGHAGTLDPDAAGVLPVCVGRATRLSDYVMGEGKTYLAEFTLGVSTDTCDASGKVLDIRPTFGARERLDAALKGFIGEIGQVPPAYSAVHVGGVKAYQLARRGEEVALKKRSVRIESLELVEWTAQDRALIRVICSKGTYIRSLARDVGASLSCGAHLSMLIRERTGNFSIEEAMTLEEIAELCGAGRLEAIPPDAPLGFMPRLDIPKEHFKRLESGCPIASAWALDPGGELFRVYCAGRFFGVARRADGPEFFARFKVMLYRPEE